jgi:hypothetical protein
MEATMSRTSASKADTRFHQQRKKMRREKQASNTVEKCVSRQI